ncbi:MULTISPECIES: FAD-dependent oxidoreductase [Paenibacillus]|uniref:FAD-dependent oxidoreductase n=1 Tax=Paenibacillus TaxID=44249 RepID=UPI0022B87882|nr:FAD dependent oxidoreductase [Paenibacillus caseinilyticus]MCZ8520361.1 FAD dependent oxidoreductase [Paenibacillus caseinilyticus]
MQCGKNRRRAVVIGGSMAGLFAARVLADVYEEVIIAERDELPPGPDHRPGTPQAYHPHRLLPRGKIILETLFPGYMEDLLGYGAFAREGKPILLRSPYGTLRVPSPPDAGFSRTLLEWVCRERVRQIANVHFLMRHEAAGLEMNPDHTAVTGVWLRERGQPDASLAAADLVVDASGRNSKLPLWLGLRGLEVPEPERLKASLGYATRTYRLPPQSADDWSVILIEGNPGEGIGTGVFGPIEQGKAEAVLYYAGGARYPAADSSEFEAQFSQLLDPMLSGMLKELEPLGPPRGFRIAECRRQRYDRMEGWPSGLLAIGDALCDFDPVYGQGITTAAIGAEVLAAHLGGKPAVSGTGFERGVLGAMQKELEPAWWLTAAADLGWAGVEFTGPYPRAGMDFARKFIGCYRAAAVGQGRVEWLESYMQVTGLMRSPRDLLNERMIRVALAEEPSGRREALLDEFGIGEEGELEAFLDMAIPAFSVPMMANSGAPRDSNPNLGRESGAC